MAGRSTRQVLEAMLSALPIAVIETVLNYRPVSVSAERWAEIRPFLVSALPPLEPQTVDAVKMYLSPLLAYSSWGLEAGVPKKWDLAFMLVVLATWIRQFFSMILRLGAAALDPAEWSVLQPEVFRPALEQLLSPATKSRRARPSPAPAG